MSQLILRRDWGARPPARPVADVRHSHVEVHHGASSNSAARQNPAAVLREYQRFHIDDKGWSDIFYNLALSWDGRLWEARGWGKKSQGSALTVVLLGDYSDTEPSVQQQARILSLARSVGGVAAIDWHARRAAGTRYASSCPGAATIRWLQTVKRQPEPATPIRPAPPITPAGDPVITHFIPWGPTASGRTAGWLATVGGALIPINGAPPVDIVGVIVAVNPVTGTVVTSAGGDFPTYELGSIPRPGGS